MLTIQTLMLLAGLFFLMHDRRIISPRSVWWSFLIRDLFWLALVLDQLAHLLQSQLFPIEVTLIITFIITSLFLFNIYMRDRAHRQKKFINDQLLQRIEELEALRMQDEKIHGHDWQRLTPMRTKVK